MKNINVKRVKDYIFLHITIIIFSLSTVASKVTSGFDTFSMKYFIGIFVTIAIMAIYAILWQQIIKKFSPTTAYSNKSVTTIWILICSALFFHEGITWNNVFGAIGIIIGVILVSQNE